MEIYQRAWRNYYVDANLMDEWLERLNSLELFKLVSICEGHCGEEHPYDASPHINLRIGPELCIQAMQSWAEFKRILGDIVDDLPGNDTYVNASIALDHSLPDSSCTSEVFRVSFECGQRRDTETMTAWFQSWFVNAIAAIELLDVQYCKFLKVK